MIAPIQNGCVYFRRGDTVRLRPNGPAMTILDILTDGSVTVTWLDRDGKTQRSGRFEPWRLESIR